MAAELAIGSAIASPAQSPDHFACREGAVTTRQHSASLRVYSGERMRLIGLLFGIHALEVLL
jgi:hypothetical protein